MHRFLFEKPGEAGYRLLLLGAHSDDIEIGCGGTILRLLQDHVVSEVLWIVFSAEERRAAEARESASLFLQGAGQKNVTIHSFRDGYFPYEGAEIKDTFEAIKTEVSPDVIFTHYRYDLHQDHRLICELTWNTFRDHLILEYEVAKYDGDLGTPNFFVHLTDGICRRKIDHIRKCFKTQGNRQWFDDDTFLSLLRLRGIESRSPQKYAEAFYCRKIIV
jgi:LmbE family N-acetylglucosaminyl deacetylase